MRLDCRLKKIEDRLPIKSQEDFKRRARAAITEQLKNLPPDVLAELMERVKKLSAVRCQNQEN
jgi:hypothetical protein